MNRRTALTSVLGFVASQGLAGCVGLGTDSSVNGTEDTTAQTTSGVDPDRDIDGDGLTACEEHQLDGAKIGRMDIYVEIDWTEGNRPASNELDRLVDVFDGAPVEASNGADPGANLHLVPGSEVPSKEEPFGLDELREYRREYFDNRGRGYHYALFVEEVSPPAFGREDEGDVLVQSGIADSRSMSPMQIFAHELGHALGLSGNTFEGIDSGKRTFDEYPSIMNYRGMERGNHLDFSDGTNSERDFDDWGYLSENLQTPDTSELDAADPC
jgi:hypothetical protein